MGSVEVRKNSDVYDIKLSSVVPASITAENTVQELSNMDLVMKLHYLRGVYYFNKSAAQGLTIFDFKLPMFKWLDLYYTTSGRIRKSDSGRPHIKCNDGGVRIIEAKCSMTLDECLDGRDSSVHEQLFPNQVLGPELAFSPLVIIQFTWFRCGGISVGLSWAHVLGDAFSASKFINMWGQIMAGKLPPVSIELHKGHSNAANFKKSSSPVTELLSIKQIESVKDFWIPMTDCRMGTFSFQLTATQLKCLQSKISENSQIVEIPVFETVCVLIWHCIANIRGDSKSRITTCRNDFRNGENVTLGNNQMIHAVEADFSIMDPHPSELATLIVKPLVDESSVIEDLVARNEESLDFILYGANLTFVDLECVDIYGLEWKGQKPVFANYSVHGVGKEGVVLVLPGPEPVKDSDGRGTTVSLVLPENEITELRNKLRENWSIV